MDEVPSWDEPRRWKDDGCWGVKMDVKPRGQSKAKSEQERSCSRWERGESNEEELEGSRWEGSHSAEGWGDGWDD